MDYDLTEQEKQDLTEKVLNKCWHERGSRTWFNPIAPLSADVYECAKCYKKGIDNRTFDTFQDAGDLMNKLIEKGWWHEFYEFAKEDYMSDGPFWESIYFYEDVTGWLMSDPKRFCWLVSQSKVWEEK